MTTGELSSADQGLLDRAEKAGEELAPLVATGHIGVNRPLITALGERGLLSMLFPAAGPVSAMRLCLLRQGLARTCPAAETALAMQGLGAYPIVHHGQVEQKKRWIGAVSAGRAVPAFALTEPEAGSDAASLALRAEPDGAGFRLTGLKTYISNVPGADVYTVFARTGAAGSRGVTAFVVPAESPGLSARPIPMLVPHPLGQIVFDGVAVGADQVLGNPGQGFGVAMATLDLFRPSVGAFAVGMAESALRMALAHAVSRHAFGQPIAGFQAVSHLLADMAVRIDAARLLVYQAAGAYDRRAPDTLTGMAAAAKLFATETAQFVVDAAIQIQGARGLEAANPLAHLYTEVRAPRIYEGTSEIQRNIISRELLAGRWQR